MPISPDRQAVVSLRARIALIDDHEITSLGFAHLLAGHPRLELVATVATVAELAPELEADLAVLDLRLSDGSSPAANIAALRNRGLKVLVVTAADSAALMQEAARAGVLGILRKSESVVRVLEALETAARGEVFATTEWAAALDADSSLADAGLSDREREVLTLYASGEKAQSVAYQTGLSRGTVSQYVARIRTKYALAGRPAHTKVELHQRAREDGLI